MADMRSFTKEFVLEFIELYKSLPCLWKIKSKEYSNRDLKNFAYTKLIDKLREQIPNADRTMVVKKLDSIRGSFRKEWKKMNYSIKAGTSTEAIYKPRLWYFNKLIFLKDDLPRSSATTTTTIEKNDSEQESTHAFTSLPSTSPKQRTSVSNYSNTSPSLKNSSNEMANSTLSDIDIILRKVSARLDSRAQQGDYYDVVAQHLAKKLRKLPQEVATVTEKLLFDLIFEAEFGNVDRQTKLQLTQSAEILKSENENSTSLTSHFY